MFLFVLSLSNQLFLGEQPVVQDQGYATNP